MTVTFKRLLNFVFANDVLEMLEKRHNLLFSSLLLGDELSWSNLYCFFFLLPQNLQHDHVHLSRWIRTQYYHSPPALICIVVSCPCLCILLFRNYGYRSQACWIPAKLQCLCGLKDGVDHPTSYYCFVLSWLIAELEVLSIRASLWCVWWRFEYAYAHAYP